VTCTSTAERAPGSRTLHRVYRSLIDGPEREHQPLRDGRVARRVKLGRLDGTPTPRPERVSTGALSAPVIASSGHSRAMAEPGHGLSATFRMTDGSSPGFRWLDVPGSHRKVLRAGLELELAAPSIPRHFLPEPERGERRPRELGPLTAH
jgi:hypothetical protein